MFLLDTNVVSESRKPRPNPGVVDWLTTQPAAALFICAFTIGELQAGVEKTRRQDPTKAAEIESWIDQIVNTNAVLPMDTDAFRIWAKLIAQQSATVRDDALIAACAKSHGLTVVTRDVKHFQLFGVPFVNPFSE